MTSAPSALGRLLKQSSHYSVASVFALVAGLVTFPVLTRTFTVADYGVMNLLSVTLSIAVGIGKLGVQQSILRFHSEIIAEKSSYDMRQLYSTTLIGMTVSGSSVALLLLCSGFFGVPWLGITPELTHLLVFLAFLVIVQAAESVLVNFLRAEQRTSHLMKYEIAKKYCTVAAILGAVLLISPTLTAFYSAMVAAECVVLAGLAVAAFRSGQRPAPALHGFSRPLYAEMLRYGVPMMIGYELSGIALVAGDRYVIGGLMGEEPLGLYSAAYNLCQYVQAVVIASVGRAIMPLYMNMYDQKGEQQTTSFISESLRTYVLVCVPVVAGLAAVGNALLPALASDKYAGASLILPWVIAGMAVGGASPMVAAGLYIQRRTKTLMGIVMASTAVNIGLNLVLIPSMGILGAALATLVSSVAVAIAMAVFGRDVLKPRMPWATLLRAVVAAALMYVVVAPLFPDHGLVTVLVRAGVGASIYLALVVAIDKDARGLLDAALSRVKLRLGKAT